MATDKIDVKKVEYSLGKTTENILETLRFIIGQGTKGAVVSEIENFLAEKDMTKLQDNKVIVTKRSSRTVYRYVTCLHSMGFLISERIYNPDTGKKMNRYYFNKDILLKDQ